MSNQHAEYIGLPFDDRKLTEADLDRLIGSKGHRRFLVRVITTAEAMGDFKSMPPGQCVLEAVVFAPSSADLHTAVEDAHPGCAAQVLRMTS